MLDLAPAGGALPERLGIHVHHDRVAFAAAQGFGTVLEEALRQHRQGIGALRRTVRDRLAACACAAGTGFTPGTGSAACPGFTSGGRSRGNVWGGECLESRLQCLDQEGTRFGGQAGFHHE